MRRALARPTSSLPSTPPHASRGAALLFVLGVLVLTVPIVAAFVRLALADSLARQTAESLRLADGVRDAVELGAIAHWLEHEAQHATLPPDASIPAVLVLHDRWPNGNGEGEVEVAVTAFDQYGMVPIEWTVDVDVGGGLGLSALSAASPILGALPGEIRSRVQGAAEEWHWGAWGLDQFALDHSRGAIEVAQPSPFPRCVAIQSAWRFTAGGFDDGLGLGELPGLGRFGSRSANPGIGDETTAGAVGAWIATHQNANLVAERGITHDRQPKPNDPPTPARFRLNVNTAPQPLLEAALLVNGQSGMLDGIVQARSQGQRFLVASGPEEDSPAIPSAPPPTQRVELVDTSGAWAFRVDVRVDRIERSWWSVYVHDPRPSATRATRADRRRENDQAPKEWTLVQRLVISH